MRDQTASLLAHRVERAIESRFVVTPRDVCTCTSARAEKRALAHANGLGVTRAVALSNELVSRTVRTTVVASATNFFGLATVPSAVTCVYRELLTKDGEGTHGATSVSLSVGSTFSPYSPGDICGIPASTGKESQAITVLWRCTELGVTTTGGLLAKSVDAPNEGH